MVVLKVEKKVALMVVTKVEPKAAWSAPPTVGLMQIMHNRRTDRDNDHERDVNTRRKISIGGGGGPRT